MICYNTAMTRHEEQVLVEHAQTDPQQFDALYRVYVDEIYRFISYKTNSREVAEDLTSQVFMQALEHLANFRYQAGARFSSWLYTIARHHVIDHYRKQRPVATLEEADPISVPETASSAVDQQFHQQRVQDILQLLPKDDQEILQLRLWQEKSYREIADILDVNAVAVRARHSRALKKFTKLYTDRYGHLS